MGDIKETPAQTIERLTAENAELTKQVEGFQAQKVQDSADEVVIREKMSHGLTREQALAVIKRQRAHDALEAEKVAKAKADKAAKAK